MKIGRRNLESVVANQKWYWIRSLESVTGVFTGK